MKFELIWLGGTILISIITLIVGNVTNNIVGFILSIICMIWFFGCVIYHDKKPDIIDGVKK